MTHGTKVQELDEARNNYLDAIDLLLDLEDFWVANSPRKISGAGVENHLGVEATNRGVWKPPKWMVYNMEKPMNKWMIWGVFTPHYFLVQHPFEFDGQKDAELSLHRDPRQKNGEWTWELEITGYEGKRWQAELPVLAGLHPQKLTWNLEMVVSNRNLLFQGSIFRFHVCFGWITSINLVKWATRPIYPQLR